MSTAQTARYGVASLKCPPSCAAVVSPAADSCRRSRDQTRRCCGEGRYPSTASRVAASCCISFGSLSKLLRLASNSRVVRACVSGKVLEGARGSPLLGARDVVGRDADGSRLDALEPLNARLLATCLLGLALLPLFAREEFEFVEARVRPLDDAAKERLESPAHERHARSVEDVSVVLQRADNLAPGVEQVQ